MRSTTRQRILEESRHLFNRRGYGDTTLAEIAAAVGIAEGNLWYHFRTKGALVAALEEELRDAVRERRRVSRSGASASDDYVEALLFAAGQKWAYRFLLRDYLQFPKVRRPLQSDPDMAADFEMMRGSLERMKKEGLFRRDLPLDLDVLSRSLWIVSRYWTDYLQEQEGLDEISWSEQQRGFEQQFAVLLPYLTASARRSIESAFLRISGELVERGIA
jgi:AcrR family transcriptional regulator